MAISDKLTYLNETKTLLKNKINITGANITNDTFRQYPTKLQNALLNCWNNEGEPIFTNWGTKVNGEGTNVKLDNTINARMKLTPKGNTSQIQYSGKNLIGVPNTTITETDFNYNVSNGVITANKTDSSYHYVSKSDLFNITTADTYTFSITILGGTWTTGAIGVRFLNSNDGQIISYQGGSSVPRETKALTTENINAISKVQVYFTAGVNCSNLQFEIQFEKGSTATTYEPYVGGTPSPNPNYPQNINVVSGDNEINVVGKNILKFPDRIRKFSEGVNLETSNNTKFTFTGTSSAGYYNSLALDYYLPKGTYTMSSTNNNFKYYFWFRDKNNAITYANVHLNNSSRTFILEEDSETIIVGVEGLTSGTTYNIETYFQLEKGDSATSYEPYTSQNYPLYLGVENLYEGSQDWSGTWVNTDKWLDDTQTYNGLAVKKRYDSWSGLYKEINVIQGETYTYSFYAKSDTPRQIAIYLTGGTGGMTPQSNSFTTTTDWVRYSITFNVLNTGTIRARVENTSNSTTNATYICGYQLEKNSKANSYTPYGTTPIELCKIGNYQDYFYKDSDKWYLHKEIGKVVLNGSERGWGRSGSSSNDVFVGALNLNHYGISIYSKQSTASSWLVNRFSYGTLGALNKFNVYNPDATYGYNNIGFGISTDIVNDIDTFKNWVSSNNIVFHYLLATPTDTEITNTTLINQLEQLKGAMSYEGQTNISSGFMIVGASALGELS